MADVRRERCEEAVATVEVLGRLIKGEATAADLDRMNVEVGGLEDFSTERAFAINIQLVIRLRRQNHQRKVSIANQHLLRAVRP
ncbi:hypothetical protein [Pelagerythrobacter aerophilus]|uniref:Uncharacterized protein n=1 Tax=Pelagerythrobacter aerophilus TaxID=2306995 RepID=A0A418NI33_9SPHN|nr:hypothetical protein [Pelagerythrobacter aerophilus]RIV78621.1 hypothetical protein D2V04_07395 [Pelagerythrobacter aerophilus]